MDSFAVVQGAALPLVVQLRDAAGTAITGYYAGTEPLAAVCWQGQENASLFAPACSWNSPTAGTVNLTISAAQTTGVEPGFYRLRLTVTDGGLPLTAWEAAVEIQGSPALTVAPVVYVDYPTLQAVAPWVDQCFNSKVNIEGFPVERARARAYFDSIILRCYRGTSVGRFGSHSASALAWGAGGMRRTTLPSPVMTTWLASNFLIVDDQVKRINAWLAAALIGQQQVGRNSVFANYGWAAGETASAEISVCIAKIDLNGDGIPDIPVPLNAGNGIYS